MDKQTVPEIELELSSGERLLWAGRPFQGFFLFRPLDMFLVPFGVIWFAFVIAAFFGASRNPDPGAPSSWIVLLVFLALGGYFFAGRCSWSMLFSVAAHFTDLPTSA
jgi:hypothetical protein